MCRRGDGGRRGEGNGSRNRVNGLVVVEQVDREVERLSDRDTHSRD